MKLWYIKTANNRNAKVLGGGLPSFGSWQRFRTEREAAEAIFAGAYDVLYADVVENIVVESNLDHESDEYNELFNASVDAEMERIKADIVERGSWHYDGISYYAEQTEELGQLYTGAEDPSSPRGLSNLEPFRAGGEPVEFLYPIDDCREMLEDQVENYTDEAELLDEPYGWTIKVTDEDGSVAESHYCWIAE